VTLRNTLLATNSGDNCLVLGNSNIADGGGNLDDATSCGFTDNTSLSNASAGLDPGGLHDNGGPTQTIALLPGSHAIDRGIEAVCADATTVKGRDQRGEPRPRDGDGGGASLCDIGAFEHTPVTCLGRAATITVFGNTIVGGPDHGTLYTGTLRGTSESDVIVGTNGNDSINGAGGRDIICGGRGPDTLRGGPGRDRLFGQRGRDRLLGGLGRDLCNGGKAQMRLGVANSSKAYRKLSRYTGALDTPKGTVRLFFNASQATLGLLVQQLAPSTTDSGHFHRAGLDLSVQRRAAGLRALFGIARTGLCRTAADGESLEARCRSG
jgi:Ca2+-binding RTX toxin-like protein